MKDSSLAGYGHLIDEAKQLAKQLVEVEFSHVKRQANNAAHNIARHGKHVRKFSVRMKDILLHIFSVIQAGSASI